MRPVAHGGSRSLYHPPEIVMRKQALETNPPPIARRPQPRSVRRDAAGDALRADAADPAAAPVGFLEPAAREALVRQLAYERYQRNGCREGHALDDWLAAEEAVGAMTLSGDAQPAAD
jgi:Protein of unknown function (DUF2934)